jgi:hypothetical protein
MKEAALKGKTRLSAKDKPLNPGSPSVMLKSTSISFSSSSHYLPRLKVSELQ